MSGNFLMVFSGIHGSHLPIKCPNSGQGVMKQYYSFKNFYSVVLLALVDSKYIFIWASLGVPRIPIIQPTFRVLHFGMKLMQVKFCQIKTVQWM